MCRTSAVCLHLVAIRRGKPTFSAGRRRRRCDRVPRRAVVPGVTRRRGPAGMKSLPTTDSDGRRPGRGTRSRQARPVPAANAEAPGLAPSRSKEGDDDASVKHPDDPSTPCPWKDYSGRQRQLLAEDIAVFNESFSRGSSSTEFRIRITAKRKNGTTNLETLVGCPTRLKKQTEDCRQ